MKLLSDSAARLWLREHYVDAPHDALTLRTSLAASRSALRVWTPPGARDAIRLANLLLMLVAYEGGVDAFAGGLIWLRDWDIWSEELERVGHAYLAGLRELAGGDSRSTDAAFLFAPGERAAAQALLALPLLFGWDAIYAPPKGDTLVWCSHHDHVDLFTRDGRTRDALVERFSVAGHHVEPM